MRERWRDLRLRSSHDGTTATMVLIGVEVAMYIACLVSPALMAAVCTGSWREYRFEYWRPLLYGITSGGLLQLVINGLALWFMGRSLESTMGSANFAALYVLSGLGAATVLTIGGPPLALGGSFAGVLGIIAAQAVFKHRAHLDIRGDLAVMVLLVVLSFLSSGGLVAGLGVLRGEWIGDLGALAVGAGVGVVFADAPVRHRGRRLGPGYAALTVVCLAALTMVWARS